MGAPGVYQSPDPSPPLQPATKAGMKSYTRFVETQTRRNPCLANLCNFLSANKEQRNVCRIVSLDFFAPGEHPVARGVNAVELRSELQYEVRSRKKMLDEFSTGNDGEEFAHSEGGLLGRMLIVEDLTKEVIEVLGSCLDIDPLFFAAHIHTPWVKLGTETPNVATLPSRTRPHKYINVHYHRTVTFQEVSVPVRNLLRDANVDRKVVVLPSTKDTRIGLAQHCVSIYKATRTSRGWLGLVLVDPPMKDTYSIVDRHQQIKRIHLHSVPFTGGFEDFLEPPPFVGVAVERLGPYRRTLLEDLVYYWSVNIPANWNHHDPTMLSLAYYPLRVVAAEWINYVAVMRHSIKQYEYSNSQLPSLLHELDKLNSDLNSLQSWRRRSMSSRQKIRAVGRFLKFNKILGAHSETWESLVEDYEHVAANLDECARLLENMLPVVTSFVQIVDSRRSFAETSNISRLTILALIFVPLTFISSIFSMNNETAPGGPKFWIYLVVAIPVTMIVFLIARPPFKHIRSFYDQIRARANIKETADKRV